MIEADKAWFVSTAFCPVSGSRPSPAPSTTGAASCAAHAELLVDGFGIPEQLRYAEMLHPEHIPDADEHEEKDAVSAGTIEPK